MFFVFFALLPVFFCFDPKKFRKCEERGFCERLRSKVGSSNFKLEKVLSEDNFFSGILKDSNDEKGEEYYFKIEAFAKGVVRLKIKEEPFNKKTPFRLNVDGDVLAVQPIPFESIKKEGDDYVLKTKENIQLIVPFRGAFSPKYYVNGEETMRFNSKNSLFVENIHYRPENESDAAGWEVSEHSGISFDVSFPGSSNFYGLPERALGGDLDLGHTEFEDEPFRLYNLDIFEYSTNNRIGIYGSIPYILSLSSSGQAAGVFSLNPSETFIDTSKDADEKKPFYSSFGTAGAPSPAPFTHFVSANGFVNVFFLPGPSPMDVVEHFVEMTGKPFMPPLFSIGYHQCRWNYKDEEDVRSVDSNFDVYDIPYDVLWLDIEHTDGKKYFTWDRDFFPTPKNMQENIRSKGRKMVTISDPHIKNENGYFLYDEAKKNNLFIRRPNNGGIYTGDCWPGKSSWLDFYNPDVREYYSELYKYENYEGSTDVLYTWIDMNEPSVFSGPEITLEGDCLHHNDVQHREIHNMYGYYHAMSTFEGHKLRGNYEERPFILSRSFFAGSQKYVAVWTGDNEASWEHLALSPSMLLSMSISGLPFVGADVGGFFGNPETDLLIRWYQMGIFYPFYRAHAHIESKRREPWLFGEKEVEEIRKAVGIRYTLLPYLYTVFRETHVSGAPVIRPLFLHYPEDENTHTLSLPFLLGRDILAAPIVEEKAESTEIYFPKGEGWYDFFTGEKKMEPKKAGKKETIDNIKLEDIPMFQRYGSIVGLKMRLRRSSEAMKKDPITLQIALDAKGKAEGEIYFDDGHSYDFEKNGDYVIKKFEMKENKIISTEFSELGKNGNEYMGKVNEKIERIKVFGLKKKPKKVILTVENEEQENNDPLFDAKIKLNFKYLEESKVLIIQNVDVHTMSKFKITIQ